MRKLTILILFVISLITLSNDWGHTFAQSNISDLEIAEVDPAEFPAVSILLRIVDENNIPVNNVNLSQLELLENGNTIPADNIVLRDLEEGNGVRVHFILDAGLRVSNEGVGNRPLLQQAKDSVVEFVRSTMIENLDAVAVTAVERTGPISIIDFSGDGEAITTAVESYPPPFPVSLPTAGEGTPPPPIPAGSYSNPLGEVSAILEEMANAADAHEKAQAIVLVSPGLEQQTTNQVEDLAARANELGIPIYTVSTRSDPTQADLRSIAEGSHGLYSTADPPEDIYRHISQLRRLYQLVYRSRANTAGTQQIEVLLDTGGTILSDQASFDIDVAPPLVNILSPAGNETITRTADSFTEDASNVPPTSYIVVAEVEFPDGYDRNLISAELFANEVSTGNLERNPDSRIEFPWDLRPYSSEGVTDVNLKVEVRDELGLLTTSDSRLVAIEVIIPPQEEVEIFIQTAVATTATSTPTLIPCFFSDPFCSEIERPIKGGLTFSNVTAIVSMAVAVLALVFAGVVWVNRGKIASAGGRVGSAVTGFVERVTSRRIQSTPRAFLVVLEGDVNVGRALEIFGDTPLGRSKQFAELLFQQHDEDSPISRLHCTIVDEETHFSIRDEDSANGTYLNGARLQPLIEEELHDGDEIELAQVERGGVKLLFQVAHSPGEGIPDSARITNPSAGRLIDMDTEPSFDEFIEGDEF